MRWPSGGRDRPAVRIQIQEQEGAPMSVAGERPAAVYRLWAADGALLYIGSSYDPERRCVGHRTKPWWRQVASRTEEWHETRDAAFRAELAAIAAEDPPHNLVGTDRESPAMHERTLKSRARGAVQSAAYRFAREVKTDAVANGASIWEASRLGRAAYVSFLDASGLFDAYVARTRNRQKPDQVTAPKPPA